jgi:O-antigen/teichoic acid export membrane protein
MKIFQIDKYIFLNFKKSILLLFSSSNIYRSSFISFFLKLIRSPFLAYLIVIYLNADELGYWYTYQAIGSFFIIFEFGISKFITIYVASFKTEFKSLKYNGKLGIFAIHSSRLFLAIYFYLFIYILSILVLFFISKFYFHTWGIDILSPFLIFLIGYGLNLFYNFYINFLYGFDFVKKRNHIENWYGLFSFFFTIIFLFFGLKLYSLGLALLITNIIIYTLDFKYVYKWIKKYFYYSSYKSFKSIVKSLDNLHWKYFATNFLSLYIFNTLTIVAMKYFNAKLAGQIGFTLFIFNSITGIANVFFYTKYPKILTLIEEKKTHHLKILIKKLLLNMSFVYFFCIISLFFLIEILIHSSSKYVNNILPTNDLIFISIVNYLAIIIGLLAQIVRAHKVEPYWKIGIFQFFSSSFLYYIIIKFNNIHLYFILDTFLNIFVLVPLHFYIGKKILSQYTNKFKYIVK